MFKEILSNLINIVENEHNSGSFTNDQLLWDITTALRGEDGGNSKLKLLSTARLRGILGLEVTVDHNGETISTNSNIGAFSRQASLTVEEIRERNILLSDGDQHFKLHFKEGMRALRALGFSVPVAELSFVNFVAERFD